MIWFRKWWCEFFHRNTSAHPVHATLQAYIVVCHHCPVTVFGIARQRITFIRKFEVAVVDRDYASTNH